ncbi:MAG: capreomycidine synthase [Chloroflexi bacterium]|nr:MAG: capreomycidine synthase [Chloroflexota bacterium]
MLTPDDWLTRLRTPALLEQWYRDHPETDVIDISSSGVRPFRLGELLDVLGLAGDVLGDVLLCDGLPAGGLELRQAVAGRLGLADAGRVMTTHGSSEGIFLALSALLEPGDEIVTLDPVYHSLRSLAEARGCQVRLWSLRTEDGFAACVDRLDAVLTHRTRAVVVNFPHNPTGVTLTPGDLDRLLAMVADASAYLVWDAAFAELAHDAPPLPDPSLRYERTISTGTLSKAYGLPGLRVGWVVAPGDVIDRSIALKDRTTLSLSPLTELIASRALTGADRLLALRLPEARRNLDALAAWAGERPGQVGWTRPAGGVCSFVRLPDEDDVAFCRSLARERGVVLVPGLAFDSPGHARLGFGVPADVFDRGLDELGRHLERRPAASGSVR